MSKFELLAKIELLNKYEAMIEEMKAEADAVRDAIKAEMTERDTEELIDPDLTHTGNFLETAHYHR